MESFYDRIKRKYSPVALPIGIVDYNTREESWGICHDAFVRIRKKTSLGSLPTPNEVDQLSLELAWFLASWGMLRNSFLLNRNYAIHKDAIIMIFENQYDPLWNYDCTKSILAAADAATLLFEQKDTKKGLYWRIKESYPTNSWEPSVTNTLVTKILHVTLGCIPAYDSQFYDGYRYFYGHPMPAEKYYARLFVDLCNFVVTNRADMARLESDTLLKSHNPYWSQHTTMKYVDMFFNSLGFDLSLLKALKNATDINKVNTLIEYAVRDKMIPARVSQSDAVISIQSLL